MITIFWAGDSTVKQNSIATFPQTGIGQAFTRYIRRDQVRVENHAENGRSTKSFIDEGRMAPIYDRITEGDFLFVQFGHNDEKQADPARYADPDGEFQVNLEKFVNVARNKKAIPVFITPVTRCLFRNPVADWTHNRWANAMREAAKRLDVALIDLTALSEAEVDRVGEEFAGKHYYMNLPVGVYPHFPNGQKDNTHLQPEGALLFAGMIAKELHKLGGQYAELLCEEFEEWLHDTATFGADTNSSLEVEN